MDVRQLLYFTTIVEEGSISAAAKKLHPSQPPLSHQLKLLEEELNLQLVQRGPRCITLTDAGRLLYKRAQSILSLTWSAKKELLAMASGYSGTLHLGAVSSSGASLLDWRIPEFHRRFPQLSFAIHEGNTIELLEMLDAGVIEVAVVRTPFHNEQVECHYLLEEPMIAAGAPSLFPASAPQGAISLSVLRDCPLILYRRFELLLTEAFAGEGISPQIFCKSCLPLLLLFCTQDIRFTEEFSCNTSSAVCIVCTLPIWFQSRLRPYFPHVREYILSPDENMCHVRFLLHRPA